jgi:hypothetical protein
MSGILTGVTLLDVAPVDCRPGCKFERMKIVGSICRVSPFHANQPNLA